jgi:outer membrane protein OmpA-like peptidoglycan-associated protein
MVPLLALAMLCTGAARPITYCTPGPYILFFDWGSADMDADKIEILDNAVKNFGFCKDAKVEVLGHTDTSEPDRVAWARSDAVHRYLADHGVPEKQIVANAMGSRRMRVETLPGIREPQNRRTEIVFSPGD